MLRKNIECAICGSKEFRAEVADMPSSIRISCLRCGEVTPIALCCGDTLSGVTPINSENLLKLHDKLHDEEFMDDIPARMILDVMREE